MKFVANGAVMIEAVAFDETALARLQLSSDLTVGWLQGFETAPDSIGCERVLRGNVVYFLSADATEQSKLLIIDIRPASGFFRIVEPAYRLEAFLRLVRAARIAQEPGRQSIPYGWSPYHAGSRQSFYARHGVVRRPARIEIDTNPRGTSHIYAFALSTDVRKLSDVQVDYGAFDAAIRQFDDALLAALDQAEAAMQTQSAGTRTNFALSTLSDQDKISQGRSTEEWLKLLTNEQRAFVECPLDRSVRLVGAAGTGKSLSLILKCLVEFEKRGARESGFRVLFLTFSQSTVDSALNAFAIMDRRGVLSRWERSRLEVCTLQTLAYKSLRLEELGLDPLTTDGLEGREWQRLLIGDQIERFKASVWPTVRNRCSDHFRRWMEFDRGTLERTRFIDALMNEFACVLEASGVRQAAEARERYLKESRKQWMMELPSEEDRSSVLEIYDMFRDELRASRHIGPDQLTADFLVELGTNRWDRMREREGYDVVFVDELHLFNRQERMIPHLLMRDPKATPILVMAYDMKQSVRDSFNTFSSQRSTDRSVGRTMGLGATERFDLNKSFRYTPQIAELLEWIDLALPAVGIAEELGDEWTSLRVSSTKESGARPLVCLARDTSQIYSTVFPRAQRRSRHLKRGNQVAVLCLSEAQFERYVSAGMYKESFIAITERGEATSVQRAGKRFVLSMPEFVAGLQFDTVYLIEANEREVGKDPREIGAYRQFVSQVYLGISRAESIVEIYASRERGGVSRCFHHAVEQGVVDVVAITDLPDVV